MNTGQTPGIDDLLPILTHDIIEAVADRPRESDARRNLRAEAARCLIESFECEDGVEIMLAGHLVLMRSVMLDSHRDSRHAPMPDGAYRHRQQTLMTMRLQLSTLNEIDRHRAGRPPVMAPVLAPVLAEVAAVETAPPRGVAEPTSVPVPEPEEEIAPEPRVEPAAMEAARGLREDVARLATLIAPEPRVEPAAMEAAQEPREDVARLAALSTGPLPALFRTPPQTPPSTIDPTEMRQAVARTGT